MRPAHSRLKPEGDIASSPTTAEVTMKKLLMNVAAVAVFLGAGLWLGPHLRNLHASIFPEPAYLEGDHTALYQEAEMPVVMFSTSTCPYCALARAYLDQAKVEYRDFVIDQSTDAQQQFQALGGGKVPLLFIGNRRIVGYREDTIRDSLALIRR